MKKLVLVSLLLCLVSPIGIEAKKKKLCDNVYWEITEDGTLTISGYGKMPSWKEPWKKRYVRKIVIEEGITELARGVFESLSSLEEVSLPSTLRGINAAFSDSWTIRKLTLNNCVYLESSTDFSHSGYWLSKIVQEDGEIFYILRKKYDECYGVVHSNGTWIVPLNTQGGNFDGCRVIDGSYYCILGEKSKEYYYSLWSNGKKIIDSKKFLKFLGGKYVQETSYLNSSTIYSVMDIKGNVIIPMSKEYGSVSYDVASNTFICHKPGYKYILNESGKEIGIQEVPYKDYEIERIGNYYKVGKVEVEGINYWKVWKDGHCGITDQRGKIVIPVEMDDIKPCGGNYLAFKSNGYWGVITINGKVIIPTSRGYTSIGQYSSTQKTIPFSMDGYKGECNHLGVQISKIKTDSATESSSSGGNKSNTTTTSDKNKTDTKEQKIIIEHHRDPVPVQQWQACWACGGMGTMGCDNCGGSGTKYIGDRLHICSRCNGQRLIPCNICHGNKGQYTTVYQ